MAKPDSASTPSAETATELRLALGKLVRRLREQASIGELTWSQQSALTRIEREGPFTVTTLARVEGVRPQSMGATVAALEAAGLVRGAPDPDDGRQTVLSLTDACRERLRVGRAAREDWLLRAMQAELSPAEQAALAAATPLLRRLAESRT